MKFLSVPAISGILPSQQNTWLPRTSSLYSQICSWVPFHVFTQDTHKNCAINAVFLMLYYTMECKQFFANCFSKVACIVCWHKYLFCRTNHIMEPCSIYAVLNSDFTLVSNVLLISAQKIWDFNSFSHTSQYSTFGCFSLKLVIPLMSSFLTMKVIYSAWKWSL